MLNINKPQTTYVFLPGWGFNAGIWNSVIEALSAKKTLTLDLPYLTSEQKIINDLDAISASLIEKIPPNSILLGWSLGGLIAIYLAYQFPERFKKLILVGTMPKFVADKNWLGISKNQAEQFQQLLTTHFPVLLKKFISLTQYPDSNKSIRNYLEQYCLPATSPLFNWQYYLHLLFTADLRAYYQQLTLPIVQLHGEKDAILPVESVLQVKHEMPNRVVEIIPQAGHALFLTHAQHLLAHLDEA